MLSNNFLIIFPGLKLKSNKIIKIIRCNGYIFLIRFKVLFILSLNVLSTEFLLNDLYVTNPERIKKNVQNKLKTILGLDANVMLESPNTLQRFEGKAKRVTDLRNM